MSATSVQSKLQNQASYRKQIKVLYVVPPSDSFAGIERVTDDLASSLNDYKNGIFNASVLYFSNYEETKGAKYNIIQKFGKRVRDIPSVVEEVTRNNKFDIVVIPQFEVAFLCLLWNKIKFNKTKIILHLHGNPSIEKRSSLRANFLFKFFKISAPSFAGIIAVSPGLSRRAMDMIDGNSFVEPLPNPVRQLGEKVKADEKALNSKNFITVGRLAYQKGHDIAIRAFRKVVDIHPDATLTIVGEGGERKKISDLIEKLSLGENVILKGLVPDPSTELAQARAFVSGSRWEGSPVAIVEALSVGLPVLSARCDFGPEDLITSPEFGSLSDVEDPYSLAEIILNNLNSAQCLAEADLRRLYAATFARDVVVERHAQYLERIARDIESDRIG